MTIRAVTFDFWGTLYHNDQSNWSRRAQYLRGSLAAVGRDADTIGAIVGSLAGAYSGEEAIPPEWRSRVGVSTGRCIGYVAGQSIADVADQLALVAWEATKE